MDLPAGARRTDLDWMRLAAALAAFLLTALRIFDTQPWLAKDPATSPIFDVAAGVLGLVIAPLFLLVSAGAIAGALERQGPASFVVSKVLRLFVPFVVVVLVAELLGGGQTYSFGLRGMYPWYLLALFASSVALLPLFRALRGVAGGPGSWIRHGPLAPAAFLAAGALPALANAFPGPGSPAGAAALGGWAPGFYPVVLALGFAIFSQPSLREQASRQSPWLVALGAVLCAALVVPQTAARVPQQAAAPLHGLAAWILGLGLFGLGLRLFAGARPLPAALNERVLPLYLLGQPITLACERLLGGWAAPPGLKLSVLVLACLLVLAGLTEAILRLNILRFLCGLRPLERSVKGSASYSDSRSGGKGK